MSFVVPMALGALTGGFGTITSGMGEGIIGNIANTVFSASATNPLTWGNLALTGAVVGGVTAGAMDMMMGPEPVAPDYTQMFGQQQSMLTEQQSFGRRPTGELEQMLEFGTDYEKNQAHDELARRGEDEQRLTEIATRRDRTEERQGEIDEYIDRNAPPTESELDVLRASLIAQEEDKLDSDIEAERTRAKQVMARRGLGSSNALSQLNARLEDVRYKGNLAIRNDVNNRVLNYAQGVGSLQTEGLNRLMKASSMEDASSRYDLDMGDAERRLQEGLRQSSTANQNQLALNKFRAEVTGMNTAYEQQMASQQNTALLGLGALGIAAPRIWPTGSGDDDGSADNSFAKAIIGDSRNTPSSSSGGLYGDPNFPGFDKQLT